jgi:hypothetical protein
MSDQAHLSDSDRIAASAFALLDSAILQAQSSLRRYYAAYGVECVEYAASAPSCPSGQPERLSQHNQQFDASGTFFRTILAWQPKSATPRS